MGDEMSFKSQRDDASSSSPHSSSKDGGYNLCNFLGVKQRTTHPDTIKKHALLLDYLASIHDSNKGRYTTTKITPSMLMGRYSYMDNRKKTTAWFNMAYDIGSILGMVDISKFSVMFRDLLMNVEVDSLDRASARRLLTVNSNWSLKRSSKNIGSSTDVFCHVNTASTLNTHHISTCNDINFNPSFYETLHPLLIILKMACDKLIENYSSHSSDEKFINALDRIDAKLRKIVNIILKEIDTQSTVVVENEILSITQHLNPSNNMHRKSPIRYCSNFKMRNYRSYVKHMEKAVAKKLPEASILNLGKMPDHLKPYSRNIPTLMHGSKIEFGTIFSSKNYNITRHIYHPSVMFRPLYSRALDLVIWTRISDLAMEMLVKSGGFDEYIITVDPKYIECTISALLRRIITEIYYSGNSVAQEYLKQSIPKDFYYKNVDREKIAAEKARVNIPPDGKLKALREKFYDNVAVVYGDDYVISLKNAFKIFDGHLAINARREILTDPVQSYLKNRKDTEVKVELSGEVDLKDINCAELRGY